VGLITTNPTTEDMIKRNRNEALLLHLLWGEEEALSRSSRRKWESTNRRKVIAPEYLVLAVAPLARPAQR
jgi:hypothetical protein